MPNFGVGAWAWGDRLFWGYDEKQDLELREGGVIDLVRNPSQVFHTETRGSLPKSYQDSHPTFRYLKNPKSSQMDVEKFGNVFFCMFFVPGFDACIKGGVKLFDTAEIYGPGRSEARSRAAEKP